ncbi:hypothetical protein KIW84_023789 [Lathyrus oleraceus]|uniref:Uncharacterized protein n=1 Tax=Pisum sativum TaxID=3888 RepID=A0A9D4YF40_PEA|nr:hypothetical protein KIW84_023789 [Pisum sativum]
MSVFVGKKHIISKLQLWTHVLGYFDGTPTNSSLIPLLVAKPIDGNSDTAGELQGEALVHKTYVARLMVGEASAPAAATSVLQFMPRLKIKCIYPQKVHVPALTITDAVGKYSLWNVSQPLEVNTSTCLKQFFKHYEKVFESRNEKEVRADYDTMNTLPVLKTPSPMKGKFSPEARRFMVNGFYAAAYALHHVHVLQLKPPTCQMQSQEYQLSQKINNRVAI